MRKNFVPCKNKLVMNYLWQELPAHFNLDSKEKITTRQFGMENNDVSVEKICNDCIPKHNYWQSKLYFCRVDRIDNSCKIQCPKSGLVGYKDLKLLFCPFPFDHSWASLFFCKSLFCHGLSILPNEFGVFSRCISQGHLIAMLEQTS